MIGVIFDDVTTIMLMMKGYSTLETNPIYVLGGPIALLVAYIGIYFLIIFIWWWLIKMYYKFYLNKLIFWRLYDLFVFLACFIIVIICFNKVILGVNNLSMLYSINTDSEYRVQLDEQVKQLDILKQTDPEKYTNLKNTDYYKGIWIDLSYLNMLLCLVFAYCLFRIGYKVVPYELY
jgi:hypothetical protein